MNIKRSLFSKKFVGFYTKGLELDESIVGYKTTSDKNNQNPAPEINLPEPIPPQM